jgi:hypothetical protein
MSKIIPLTQGKEAIVDDEDFEYLNQWKWRYSGGRRPGYAITGESFKKGGRFRMHRLIVNAPSNIDVDHINGNRLDNRRENLRFCNQSQNLANSKLQVNNTSGYKGVCWNKRIKKWHSQVGSRKNRKNLGEFNTAEEAAKAHDEAAKKLYGEFAKLNFD